MLDITADIDEFGDLFDVCDRTAHVKHTEHVVNLLSGKHCACRHRDIVGIICDIVVRLFALIQAQNVYFDCIRAGMFENVVDVVRRGARLVDAV